MCFVIERDGRMRKVGPAHIEALSARSLLRTFEHLARGIPELKPGSSASASTVLEAYAEGVCAAIGTGADWETDEDAGYPASNTCANNLSMIREGLISAE